MSNYDFFYRTACSNKASRRTVALRLESDVADASWDVALRLAGDQGLCLNRGTHGVFEIQTDTGIWSRVSGRAFPHPDKGCKDTQFVAWDDLDLAA
jgi:hypothetical protein